MADRYVGDFGQILQVTVTDISFVGATLVEIRFRKPNGVEVTVTASGVAGQVVSYTFPSGFLDLPGRWSGQALATYGVSEVRASDPFMFVVGPRV